MAEAIKLDAGVVVLALSVREAETLSAITAIVGGDYDGPRGHMGRIDEALTPFTGGCLASLDRLRERYAVRGSIYMGPAPRIARLMNP